MSQRSGGNLRVHGGEARGRRLLAPRSIRPTQGVVKEAIFNLIAPLVPGTAVVDLFSGSGALGIEALSRGARQATFVERDHSSVTILRRNLEALQYTGRATIVAADVLRWLRARPPELQAAGLVVVDPPYGEGRLEAVLGELDQAVSPGATVVIEHAASQNLPPQQRLPVEKTRRYGGTQVTILRAQ